MQVDVQQIYSAAFGVQTDGLDWNCTAEPQGVLNTEALALPLPFREQPHLDGTDNTVCGPVALFVGTDCGCKTMHSSSLRAGVRPARL